MASTQATIDLVVRGSNAVNKLIQDVGQLESAVNRINSKTLDVATKKIGEATRKISEQIKNVGTANDPRPDVAQRVAQLTNQQTSSTRALAAARDRLAKSSDEAARAEEQLIERSQRRTRADSQAQRSIEDRLNKSRGLASAASGEINQLSGRLRSIAREFAAIQRTSAQAIIPETKNLIDTNQVAATQRAIKVLAQEFNRLGDSAKFGIEESNLSRNVLPRQTSEFNKLSDQLAEARVRAQALREELVAIGRNEKLVRAPSAGSVILGQGQSAAEMIQALKNQPTEADIAGRNQGIMERNQARQRQRAGIRTSLGQESTLIGQLEEQAVTAGRKVVELQDKLADLVEFRYKTEPQTGRDISLNQIQAQAEALTLVANNSAVATDAFRQYTVASEVASIKLARTQQETFAALAAGFSTSGGVQAPAGLASGDLMAGARSLVGQVVTEMPTFATGASEAALGGYINMLQSLKAIVPGLSVEYRALEEAIARANEEMRSAQLGIVGAPSNRLGSLEAVTQRQQFEEKAQRVQEKRQKDINDVFEKQSDITDQINSSRLSSDEKASFRERTERAVNALIEDRLEDSKEMTRLIERQLKASMNLLKAKPAQVFGVTGEQFLPLSGKTAAGEMIAGSPAAKSRTAEEQRKSADRQLKEESDAFKNLTKYTQEAERNAQKLQASYDRLDLTQALDEYLADLSNVEQAADKVLKKLASVPETGQSRVKEFDNRLKAAVDSKGAGNQLSSQTLQLEKLQKRLVEVEIDGVDVSSNRATVEKLIADIKSGQIPTSKQSVDLVAKELKDARARLGISQSQAKIDGKIADVLKGAVGGPSKKINDLAAQQKYATAINDTYQKTEEILTSIGKASISDAQKLSLSFGIDQARNELYENRLENAQEITKEVNRQLKLETAMQKGAGGGRKTSAADPLKEEGEARRILSNQLAALQDIQTRYATEEKKGVQLANEKIELGKLINAIKNDEYALTKDTTKAIGESIRLLNAYGRYAKNRAIEEGTYAGGSKAGGTKATTAEQLEDRRSKLLNVAAGGLSKLIDLENKGVAVSEEKLKIEKAIKDIQSLRGQATQKELVALAREVAAAKELASIKAVSLKAGAIPGVGLQAALQSLQEARNSRQQFLGTMSPAEGIDKIVREFNTGKTGGAASGAAGAGENAASSYVNGIRTGIPAAAKAMIDLGKAGVDAIKKALGIASPSKVMLAIAQNLINTYVDYLQSALPQVEAAAKAIGEASAPSGASMIPEEAINRPLTEKQKTRPLDAERIARNQAIGQFAATQIEGPFLGPLFDDIAKRVADFVGKTRTSIDLEKFYGPLFEESQRFAAVGLRNEGLDAKRAALADFYEIPPELTPGLKRAAASGDQATQEAIQLNAAMAELVAGLNSIAGLISAGAALASPGKAQDPFAEARRIAEEADAANAAAARERASISAGFEDSIAKAAEIDAENARKIIADSFAASKAQAEADARAGVLRFQQTSGQDILSRQILDPAEAAASEGEGRVRSAIEQLFDRVAKALGFGGGGPGGPRPPIGGGPGGGFYNDPGDLARRATEAAQQGPEALLGLKELAAPAKVSTKELEALSAILKEFRSVLDPTVEGFDQLNKRLRNTAVNIDRQLERREPDADFLTRNFGSRGGAAISEGLIGGAFPLLFGQGIGASVGGGLGGAGGGFLGGGLGFGLSLIGTALGTAFDTAVQGATELGAALSDTSLSFDKVKEKALFSSKETEKLATKLTEAGFAASASILAQQEIINKVGASGYKSLIDLANSSDGLGRAWGEFNLQLQAALAGPMAGLLEWVASILALENQSARSQQFVKDVSSGLGGGVKEEFDREARIIDGRERQGSTIFGTLLGGLSKEDATKQRNELAQLYAEFAIPVKVEPKLTQKQVDEQVVSVLEKRLQVIDIAKGLKDQATASAREQQNIDNQRAELVRSYEESLASLREKVEERVSALRLQTLEKENQLLDVQSSIRLKSLEIANQQIVAEAGVGERPEVAAAAKEVAQIVADYTQNQLTAEEEGARIKRDAALDALKTDLEAAKFKISTEKEISRLNTETARKVAEINRGVREKNQDIDQNKFKLEQQIAGIQLKAIQSEFALLSTKAVLASNAGVAKEAARATGGIAALVEQTAALRPPGRIKEIATVGGGDVSFAGIDKASAEFSAATKNFVAAQLALNDLDPVKNTQEFTQRIAAFADKTDQVFTGLTLADSDEQAKQLRYGELISKGLTDTVAQKVIELETTKAIALAMYDIGIAQLQNRMFAVEKNEAQAAHNELLVQEINLLMQRKAELEGTAGDFNQGGATATGAIGQAIASENGKQLQAFIDRGRAELNDLEAVAVRVSQSIGDAVGNSLSSGISGLIEGTATAKEVFAGFLRDVGQLLVQEGTKMIATYVAIAIAKTFAGLGGGGGLGFGGNSDPLGVGGGFWKAANGATFSSGTAKFAKGGTFTNSIVSSPTLFKFANGGTTQMGEMGEAGPEAIMPLSRGRGGRLGVDASGLREAMGRPPGGAGGSPVLNMSFQSTTINGVEYVSRDQLEAAMVETRRQAAKEGASRGMDMTLDKIQNSPSTRSRVGIR